MNNNEQLKLKSSDKSSDEINILLNESLKMLNMLYLNQTEKNDDSEKLIYNNIQVNELYQLLSNALKALCLTHDYVGEDILPALEGWSWYDSGKEIANYIADDKWSYQFRLRVEAYKLKKLRQIFKTGDWIYAVGDKMSCYEVFEDEGGNFQPFSFLKDYDPTHFILATAEKIAEA